MSDNLIARAQEKREWHLAQAAKYETFLATFHDLQEELTAKPAKEAKTDAEKTDAPVRQRQASRPREGIGADTLNAAEAIIRERGPMSTREMLPLILARGIEVGGRDPVATLSARVSHKGDLVTYNGKWHFKSELPASALNGAGKNEAADNPTKDQSAASSVSSNQGGSHGTALI